MGNLTPRLIFCRLLLSTEPCLHFAQKNLSALVWYSNKELQSSTIAMTPTRSENVYTELQDRIELPDGSCLISPQHHFHHPLVVSKFNTNLCSFRPFWD